MQKVGEHPIPAGPLAVRWLGWELREPPRAGKLAYAELALENAGATAWRGIELSYHWLDDRGNAIVWGERWTPLPKIVEAGRTITQRAELRGPLGTGSYRLAFDLVDKDRYWFSDLGNTRLELDVDVQPRIARRALAAVFTPGPSELVAQSRKALEGQEEALVEQGDEEALGHLAPGCLPAPDWSRRVLDAHEEGFAVVAGSIETTGRRRPKSLRPWQPGTGRVPNFAEPLLCPSLVPGSEPSWDWSELEGLPALAQPASEPWLYDGRIVVRAPPRSGRRHA